MMAVWRIADLGFDTQRLRWFVSFLDGKFRPSGSIPAETVTLQHGTTYQREWLDDSENPNEFFHIRSSFAYEQVHGMTYNGSLVVDFKPVPVGSDAAVPTPLQEGIEAMQIGYSRKNGLGFVELLAADGEVKLVLKDRRLSTVNLSQRTVGDFPNIRLQSERAEVAGLVITPTTCVVVGTE
jgi:hypothetical protein